MGIAIAGHGLTGSRANDPGTSWPRPPPSSEGPRRAARRWETTPAPARAPSPSPAPAAKGGKGGNGGKGDNGKSKGKGKPKDSADPAAAQEARATNERDADEVGKPRMPVQLYGRSTLYSPITRARQGGVGAAGEQARV